MAMTDAAVMKISSTTESALPESMIDAGRSLAIVSFDELSDHLQIRYTIDHVHQFLTKIIYPRGTFAALHEKVSQNECERLWHHIAFMEGLKFIAVMPTTYDITPIAAHITAESLAFFTATSSQAWSEHYFENNITCYHGPKFLVNGKLFTPLLSSLLDPQVGQSNKKSSVTNSILVCNGGGKDSFLVCKILEEAGIPISIFQHARTEYGRFDHQHSIQKKPIAHLNRNNIRQQHDISIIDDFTEGTIMTLLNPCLVGGTPKGHPCQVGWPEMVFEALPFVLLHDYSGMALGNERSADSAQASWIDESNRQVNHQWLKSHTACRLLDSFIKTMRLPLPQEFTLFSLLKPMYDYRIYKKLSNYPEVLPRIHSCNIIKPWCHKCSKCCYVFVNLTAWFGPAATMSPLVFGCNLFDDPENMVHWKQLLGLADHNAFECVGENGETQLAFLACTRKFLCTGGAIDLFRRHFLDSSGASTTIDEARLLEKYDRVYDTDHGIPDWLFGRVFKFM